MGGRLSRREVVPQNGVAKDGLYKYPSPDGGNYFSSHFRLGHRKYETGDPEYFLFGDMSDINFLNKKPVQFPYKQPEKQEPLQCLQALINIHRDSVRIVRCGVHVSIPSLSFPRSSIPFSTLSFPHSSIPCSPDQRMKTSTLSCLNSIPT
jgi:hypothetical protein